MDNQNKLKIFHQIFETEEKKSIQSYTRAKGNQRKDKADWFSTEIDAFAYAKKKAKNDMEGYSFHSEMIGNALCPTCMKVLSDWKGTQFCSNAIHLIYDKFKTA